jgi:hypothetical protein
LISFQNFIYQSINCRELLEMETNKYFKLKLFKYYNLASLKEKGSRQDISPVRFIFDTSKLFIMPSPMGALSYTEKYIRNKFKNILTQNLVDEETKRKAKDLLQKSKQLSVAISVFKIISDPSNAIFESFNIVENLCK